MPSMTVWALKQLGFKGKSIELVYLKRKKERKEDD